MKKYALLLLLGCVVLAGCKHAVTATDLHGKWNYTRLEHPNQSPPGVMPTGDLREQAPYIEFMGDSLRMVWGGQLLSHGTFTVDGTNINYKEILSDGSTRSFPFYISSFKDNTMVFETMGDDASRVTVVKE